MSLSDDEPDPSFANWLYVSLMLVNPDFIDDIFGTTACWLSAYLGGSLQLLIWESSPRAVFVYSKETGRAIRADRSGWVPCSCPTLVSGQC